MAVLQKHVDSGADISVACVPMDERPFTFAPCSLLNLFFVLVLQLAFSWITKQSDILASYQYCTVLLIC